MSDDLTRYKWIAEKMHNIYTECNCPGHKEYISDLEDRVYHTSRDLNVVKYVLGHEIEELKKTLKIAEEFLNNIDHYDAIEDGLTTLGEALELIRRVRGVD